MPRSVFDIIGPIMIGPSSSHTAGAVRIGRFARIFLGEKPVKAAITFYGSFAKTYKGHGTDRAVISGLLGMNTDDPRIKSALEIAPKEGLEVLIRTAEDPDVHPNTVEVELAGLSGKTSSVKGSSIGGGNISIFGINEYEVNISGGYPTLLIEHLDKPGTIGSITTILGKYNINIGEMRMGRSQRGANNFLVIETDQLISAEVLTEISKLPGITYLTKIESF